MTNQEKIRWLGQYRKSDLSINRKVEEISRWRERAEKITPSLTGMPQDGGEDKIQSAVDHIWELQQEVNRDIDDLIMLRRSIEEAIASVENETLRILLEYRYIDGKKWEQIAVDMNYCWQHIHKLHSRALHAIECDTKSVI